MTALPERCLRALRYYARENDVYCGMPNDIGAYNTLNALLYDDVKSELARAKEGKPLNPALRTFTNGCKRLINVLLLLLISYSRL